MTQIRAIFDADEIITSLTGKMGRPSLCISESGLYKLIMRSDKLIARTFLDCVTREVPTFSNSSKSYTIDYDLRPTKMRGYFGY